MCTVMHMIGTNPATVKRADTIVGIIPVICFWLARFKTHRRFHWITVGMNKIR